MKALLEADKMFSGSIPENYDRHMVLLIFELYAIDIARRVAALSPGAVLEIAAGSGVVTRAYCRQTWKRQDISQDFGPRHRGQGLDDQLRLGPSIWKNRKPI